MSLVVETTTKYGPNWVSTSNFESNFGPIFYTFVGHTKEVKSRNKLGEIIVIEAVSSLQLLMIYGSRGKKETDLNQEAMEETLPLRDE